MYTYERDGHRKGEREREYGSMSFGKEECGGQELKC